MGVSEIEDQGEVAVVDGDAGDIDDAGDAFLSTVSMCEGGAWGSRRTLDSSESWNMVTVWIEVAAEVGCLLVESWRDRGSG